VPELRGVAHLAVAVDDVTIPPAYALAFDEPGLDKVGHDPLSRSLGDSDLVGDVPEPGVWIASDAEQNLRVVRQKPPARGPHNVA
jgi:hypothetical protein